METGGKRQVVFFFFFFVWLRGWEAIAGNKEKTKKGGRRRRIDMGVGAER